MKTRYSKFVDRINVEAVEEDLGFEVLEEKGDEHRGQCILPYGMHSNGDTTGKLYINQQKKVYQCFVCGGGSLLSMVMAVKNIDVQKAVEWLYQYAGDELPDATFQKEIEELLADHPEGEVHRAPIFNERVLGMWEGNDNPWFKERGISPEVAKEFRIGYDSELVRHAPMRNNKPIDEDYVGPGIILPHFWNESLVGWQIRWLEDDRPKWCPKYTNTPDFPKKYTLFNFDRCVARNSKPVIVESVPTALFLETQGIHAIATFGSGVSRLQLEYLRRFQDGVIIGPDNDDPGEKYVEEITEYLEKYIPVQIALPPEGPGADLGDLVSEPKLLDNLVKEAYYA